jgi:hypothetical protein
MRLTSDLEIPESRRDRGSEGRQGIPVRFFVTALLVLAAVVVLASLVP